MDSPNNLKSAKRQDSKKIIAKRFSDEQIKSLESIFKLETKLDPKKKSKLANDLGLQPRQVAIWFQNKRARWKSKQIEEEYKELKENYDNLNMKFDDLQREKQFLQTQLKELNGLTNEDDEFKEYPNSSNIEEMDDHNIDVMKTDDDDENIITTEDLGKTDYDQQDLVSWNEEADIISHLSSPENWCDFSSGGLFGQSPGASSWWEN